MTLYKSEMETAIVSTKRGSIIEQQPGLLKRRAFVDKLRYEKLYAVQHEGISYLYRALTLREMRGIQDLMSSLSDETLDDLVVCTCLVIPEFNSPDDLNEYARQVGEGIIDALSTAIMKVSRAATEEEAERFLKEATDRAEDWMSDAEMWEVIRAVCRVFPGYTPDSLFDMNVTQLLTRMTLAENAVSEIQEVEGEAEIFSNIPFPAGAKIEEQNAIAMQINSEILARELAKHRKKGGSKKVKITK